MNSTDETTVAVSTTEETPLLQTDETTVAVSTEETPLLQTDEPNQPRIKNLRTKIFFLLRILLVLIADFFILFSIYREKPEPVTPYFSGLARYYCHLTPHPTLCNDSMSSLAINATTLESDDPAPIFALPLQLVVNELSRANISITAALSSLPASNASRLTSCQFSIRNSLSRLGEALELLSADSSHRAYPEEQYMMGEMTAVESNIRRCLLALGDGVGVEEVKMGVEKASLLRFNFVSIFEGRDLVLDDFDNRYHPLHYSSDVCTLTTALNLIMFS